MPRNRWFFGRRGSLRDRVVNALQQARDGDPEAGVEMLAERFPEALAELTALGKGDDPAWFRLAAQLAYRAGEMPGALRYAEQALVLEEDGATWHLLGRVKIWLRKDDAAAAFRRAAELDRRRFVIPYRVTHKQFMRMAEAALATVPEAFQARLANTLIVIDDLPDLESVQHGEDPDLLGVYEGATALEHGLPERIVLYQRNHENVCANQGQLEREVRETMRHEIGHHFGMAEDDLPY